MATSLTGIKKRTTIIESVDTDVEADILEESNPKEKSNPKKKSAADEE